MNENQSTAVARIDSLTGLRFFAAMMVFCFHLDRMLKTNVTSGPIGSIAVSFFFVLSGFILTYVYRDRLKTTGVGRFYFTRWARIWPLHAVCLIAAMCLMPHGRPVDYPGLRIFSHAFLLQSWIPIEDYILSLNGVSWSISTEAFFYFMFPLLLLGGLKRFVWKALATIAISIVALLMMTHLIASPTWNVGESLDHVIHFNPALRLLEFVAGMGTAYIFMSKRLNAITPLQFSRWPAAAQTLLEIAALTAAVMSFYFLRDYGYFRWFEKDLGWGREVTRWLKYCGGMPFHAICIFVFAKSNGWIARGLRTKPMVFLGEVSFALYMVHRIVFWVLIRNFWMGSTMPYWIILSSCFLVTLGVSALLFLFVEMPAKAALTNCYDRKFSSAWSGLIGSMRNLLSRRLTYSMIALIVIPTVVLNLAKRQDQEVRPAETLIAQFGRPPIRFGDQLSLAAWTFEPRRMGIEIALVWRTQEATDIRHLYAMTKAKFAFGGRLTLPKGDSVQTYFIDENFWKPKSSPTLKLWYRNKPLMPRYDSALATDDHRNDRTLPASIDVTDHAKIILNATNKETAYR